MNTLSTNELPDVSPSSDRRYLESMSSATSSAAEESLSEIASFTILPQDDSTISEPENRLQIEETPANHHSVTPEERLLSHETLVPDETRSPEHAKRQSTFPRLQKFHRWWFWELGGIIVSVCCMIAILVLLPYLDDRPLNDWKFLVAPNTMISTFITLAKTSMLLAVAEGISQLKWHNFKTRSRPLRELDLLDAASRGPWGAFVFIIRMAGKRGALLSMLGAFVMIASLTMEPFAQQILSFEGRQVNSTHEIASFSVGHVWNSTDHAGKGQQSMESAFMKGLIGSPAEFQFFCSSGNCTWPDFSALSFCASCADTTERSKITQESQQQFNKSEGSDVSADGPPDDCIDMLYITPTGLELKMSRGCSFVHRLDWDQQCDNLTGDEPAVVIIHPTKTIIPNPNNTVHKSFMRLKTHTPTKHQSEDTAIAPTTSFVLSELPPTTISILCREQYQTLPTLMASNATYSDFTQRVSNSTIAIFAVSQANVTGNGLSGRIKGIPKITECQLSWCETLFRNVEVNKGALQPMNVTKRQLNEFQLNDYIGYWRSWAESGRHNNSFIPDAWKYIADQMSFTMAADGNIKFGPGSVISDAEDVLEVLNNIAEAMTRQLYVNNGSIQQPGFAYVQEVFVVVRWQWAAFPMVLVLLGIIFLAINIWINRRDGVFLWKSSLLPLLFHGLDGFDAEALDVNENSEMNETAKRMYARLGTSEAGSTKLVST